MKFGMAVTGSATLGLHCHLRPESDHLSRSDSQMANPPFSQKRNLTFTAVLFFISFLLMLPVLLSSGRTLKFFRIPPLYRALLTPTFKTGSFSPPPESVVVLCSTSKAQSAESPFIRRIVGKNRISALQNPDFNDRNRDNGDAPVSQIFQFEERQRENGENSMVQKSESPVFTNGSVSVRGELDDGGAASVDGVRWGQNCNLYMGKWVRDDKYPIYMAGSCPYVDEAFDCQSNGRPDSDYLKWRWKPDGCHLPRFNATDFLVRLRGKRLMLVGDSMNRNQFESMLCLLREGLPNKTKMYETHGYKITKGRGYYVFKFVDYNCTVEFTRSHFLVKEGIRINGKGNSNPTLSIDQIDKTARRWKRADILIFNTGHWWTHGKTARGKNYFKEGDLIYARFDAIEAYRKAMRTWAKWIDSNVNPVKKLVFYRAYSSAHFRGGDWDSGGTCNGETEPISSGAFLDNYPLKMKIVEEVIQQMQVPVTLLNITRLTNFRKDGHPSIYGKNRTTGVKVSTRRQDCSHWCLPGVPDAWNELIYAALVFQQNHQML